MRDLPKLIRRLMLETWESAPDGAGGQDGLWLRSGVLWAEIKPASGAERLGEEAALSRTRLKIIVRAAPHGAPSRPRPEDRFREGGRIYRILSVQDADPGMRYLTCIAEEEVVA
jgi:head-tail adaptor